MIESILISYLSDALDVPVYAERPEDSLDTCIVIQRTGGDGDSRIYSAVVAIQSYGATLYDAASLNGKVKAAMESIDELDSVSSCKLNSDYDFTNYTGDKRYRYQAVYQITYY